MSKTRTVIDIERVNNSNGNISNINSNSGDNVLLTNSIWTNTCSVKTDISDSVCETIACHLTKIQVDMVMYVQPRGDVMLALLKTLLLEIHDMEHSRTHQSLIQSRALKTKKFPLLLSSINHTCDMITMVTVGQM